MYICFLPQYLFHRLVQNLPPPPWSQMSSCWPGLGTFKSFKIKYLMNTLIYEAFYILMYLNDFWYIYSSYLWPWEHWICSVKKYKVKRLLEQTSVSGGEGVSRVLLLQWAHQSWINRNTHLCFVVAFRVFAVVNSFCVI